LTHRSSNVRAGPVGTFLKRFSTRLADKGAAPPGVSTPSVRLARGGFRECRRRPPPLSFQGSFRAALWLSANSRPGAVSPLFPLVPNGYSSFAKGSFFPRQLPLAAVRHFGADPPENLIRQLSGFSPDHFYEDGSWLSFRAGRLESPRFRPRGASNSTVMSVSRSFMFMGIPSRGML
jgi:hypothetical protein